MDEPIKLLPRRRVDLNPWRTFFSGVILTPIIEELTFRLNLKYSKLNFSIMVGGFIVFFVLNRFLDYSRLFNLLIGLLCVIVTFLMLKKFDDRIFIDFWKKQKKAIFYSSILLFASLHLANYQMTPNLFLFLPIVLLTYLIGGFFFSYGRFKYGVFFAIGLHMLNNLIPFIASSIFS